MLQASARRMKERTKEEREAALCVYSLSAATFCFSSSCCCFLALSLFACARLLCAWRFTPVSAVLLSLSSAAECSAAAGSSEEEAAAASTESVDEAAESLRDEEAGDGGLDGVP